MTSIKNYNLKTLSIDSIRNVILQNNIPNERRMLLVLFSPNFDKIKQTKEYKTRAGNKDQHLLVNIGTSNYKVHFSKEGIGTSTNYLSVCSLTLRGK